MASAQDYPVNNPYDPPRHNGKDRAQPTGTDIFPNDKRMKSGNTGLSTGPHLHTQAGPDFYAQKFIDPTRHEFQPGEVVQVGWGDEWGNYVIVKNFTSGIYVVYCHLSVVNVQPGDIVGRQMESTKTSVIRVYRGLLSRDPNADNLAKWTKVDEADLIGGIYKSDTRTNLLKSLGVEGFDWAKRIRDLQTRVKELESGQATPQPPPVDEYEEYIPPTLYTKKQQ